MTNRPHERHTLGHRYYDLYPATTGKGPRPLVVGLHGWGMTIDGTGRLNRIHRRLAYLDQAFPLFTGLLDRPDVHFAFPQAKFLGGRNWKDRPAGAIGPTRSRRRGNPDAEFIAAVRHDACGRLPVRIAASPRSGRAIEQVCLFGFSDGVVALDITLRAYGELFAGGAVRCSGKWNRALRDRIGTPVKMPVYITSGDTGRIERYARPAAARAAEVYRSEEHRVELVRVSGQGHDWPRESNDAIWSFLRL
jgi:predicted esterase